MVKREEFFKPVLKDDRTGYMIYRGLIIHLDKPIPLEHASPIMENWSRYKRFYYCKPSENPCFNYLFEASATWNYPYRVKLPALPKITHGILEIYGVRNQPVYTAILYMVINTSYKPVLLVSSPLTYMLNKKIVSDLRADGVIVVEHTVLRSTALENIPVHTIVFDPTTAFKYTIMYASRYGFYGASRVVVLNPHTNNFYQFATEFFRTLDELPLVVKERVIFFLIRHELSKEVKNKLLYALDKIVVPKEE